jgi:hypothetical protein
MAYLRFLLQQYIQERHHKTKENTMERTDSEAVAAYWLRTVLEDRAESAPSPAAPMDHEGDQPVG